MDRFVASLAFENDGDLRRTGWGSYQADMTAGRVEYDAGYLDKCDAYDGNEIARAVNAGRLALLSRHLESGARILDIGAGSGAFVRDARSHGFEAYGFDVIPEAAERLMQAGVYADVVEKFGAVTMWDVLEHIETPEVVLRTIQRGAKLFISVPVFDDLRQVRKSRHYRPGEHLYYWTAAGLEQWMGFQGFTLLEQSWHEVEAGRDSIGAFAFIRSRAASQDRPCECGGEARLEYYQPPHRPLEWFMRCYCCDSIGPVGSTEVEARRQWNGD